MRVIGYYPLHYGKEYLKESILSINDVVEKVIILYTSKPSYGYNAHMICPETEEELKDIVFSTTNKAEWVNITATNEGEHRSQIARFSEGYDLFISTDADEVWNTQELEAALKTAHSQNFRQYGIDGFLNFWKDFSHVCIDGFRPHRIYKPSGQGVSELKCTIYHFGYCISESLMRYKWAIHGHHSELRKGWIDDVYLKNGLNDLHPVAVGLWNAQHFDKNLLPEILKKHPKWNITGL